MVIAVIGGEFLVKNLFTAGGVKYLVVEKGSGLVV
jgi:hypothetical protein